MIVLHGALLFVAAIVFSYSLYCYHVLTGAGSLCPIIKNSALKLVGGVAFITLAFFVLEIRWISLGFGEKLPASDEMSWGLLRGAKLCLLYYVSGLCRNLVSCDIKANRCLLDRRRN